jgi:hypothetical protein
MSELDSVQSAPTLATSPDVESSKSDELKQNEQESAKTDYAVAALNDHPGWKVIRGMMADDIDAFKSLSFVDMKKYSNAELGEVVRVEHMVATKLQTYLDKVDQTVLAVSHG